MQQRVDIQGLRAVAVAAVVIYHLWPAALPGGYVGVDVFLVISGFLITSHLVRRWPGTVADLTQFWARRVKRLLPAALLVIAVTLVATRAFAPETEWRRAAGDAIASTLYFQNWRLAHSSVDYMAEGQPPGALQHYWSLSVEEQFYAFWPVLLIGCFLLARRSPKAARRWAILGVLAVLVSSLLWSVVETHRNPAGAYFVTTTRGWELAVGGLLALVVRAAPRPRVGVALASLGVLAIIYASAAYSPGTAFPGYAAVLPVLGTAAVIAADVPRGRGTNRVLATAPFQGLGDISYSVYLWHWAFIVMTPWVTNSPLRFPDKVAVLGLTLVVATASKRYVEDPARTHPWRRPVLTPYRFAALGMSVVVVVALAQTRELDRRARADELAIMARSNDPCFAAGSLARQCPTQPQGEILPRPALATQDTAATLKDHCRADEPFTAFKSCVYGDPDARTRIALIGNSHAEQWLPALQQAFAGQPVAIVTYVAGKCFVNPVPRVMTTKQATDNCRAWSEWAMHEVTTRPFDLVVDSARTYGAPAEGPNSVRTFEAGYERDLRRLVDAGRKVLVIRDTPVPGLTGTVIPNCVAVHPANLEKCAAPRGRWLNRDPLVVAARRVDQQSLWVANLTNFICRPDRCRPVEGGALVYMDHSHLTATYSRSLAPYLRPYVLRALGWSTTRSL